MQLSFTVSLGVATTDIETCHDIEDVINNADKALYVAKKSGRNRVEVYSE